MGKRYAFLMAIVSVTILQIIPCTMHDHSEAKVNIEEADVVLFNPLEGGNYDDLKSYAEIARELGLTTREVDHTFINKRESFFNKDDQRRFEVLVLPGGEPYLWFKQATGRGITCQGVRNILAFIESGGSVITICICGTSIFSTHVEWLNPDPKEAQRGEWDKTHVRQGLFLRLCGTYAFKGVLRGPQETNRPYPTTRFLAVKMNPQNEIVREANLPAVVYQIVVGGGSIIPDEGQSLDVVGWFPNGTPAIGIVPYGHGRIIMSNPHPNITGSMAERWIKIVMGEHARRWGWTEDMIENGKELIKNEKDPDGSEPDWALAKAMLSYAHIKASQ